ncbi:hypothetical protein U9M48_003485 [Paspalum notatum var. saurae]|uniref:Endonuclease/exonuclease/phosphatase domain-containing protein n=1 Tax=Paspalum notatum var. saurae TaxID=547442 RepID=A0AAQ3PL38_PASNO
MNAIAWNCRGLGNSRTVRELSGFVRLYHPQLVFLSETRMNAARARNLVWRLGLRNSLAVGSNGLSGGIALFWDDSVSVTLLGQSERFIDVLIKECPDQPAWRATFVYGEPRVENRRAMWDTLRNLFDIWEGPWLVFGDFNEAMWQFEHFSETPRPERQMLDFREVLSHCDLHDLGFSGLPWTYNNNQSGRRNVRGVANAAWSTSFPNASITHVNSACSDHKVLVLRQNEQQETLRANPGFRYEIMWERDEFLGVEIEKTWARRNPGSDLGGLAENLKQVASALRIWSREKFGHVNKEIEKLRKELDDLEWEDPVGNRAAICFKVKQLNEILYREEMMWLQRSRISWLKEGIEIQISSTGKLCGVLKRIESRN